MAVYYVYSGAGGSNNGSSWANAFTTLTTAFATEAVGDTLYVAHDHAESTAGAVTLTSNGTGVNLTKVVCVDRGGSVPPVSADRRTTAQVSTTGSNGITINGRTHFDGIIFNCATGAVGANLTLCNTSGDEQRFDNCSLRLGGTSAGAIRPGTSSGGGHSAILNNTTMQFSAVNQTVTGPARLIWYNTPSALLGTIPTILFTPQSNVGGLTRCIGVDFSAAGSGKTIAGSGSSQCYRYEFYDCKLDASVTKSVAPSSPSSTEVDFIRSTSSGINYTIYCHRYSGALSEETTIVRTGGASDGTTSIAWKIITTTTCTFSTPFECPLIAVWNDTTGSSVTATVEGIWGGGAVPNDDDIWLEVQYLGDASSSLASFVNDGKANLLVTAAGQTSSSETWGGSTTKFKLAVSFTPQMKGWVYGRIRVGKASTTMYVDPKLTLS
jgi:hypothetical protein